MKITLTTLLLGLSTVCFAQEYKYPHCNCTETYTENGSYKLVSNGTERESGTLVNGLRDGLWVSKTKSGIVLRKANYSNGQLHGTYALYHFDGTPKLTAEFKDGLLVGSWKYYNEKRKIIKEGSYTAGRAIGIWKIYDLNGKQLYAEYNFDTNAETVSPVGKQYFKKGGILRDDLSGEWMILYLPHRNITVKSQPFGGYMLASDLFVDYFNLPTVFMDTYAQFEFNTKVKLEHNVATIESITLLQNNEAFDITSHSLPFMVDTNPPSKLSRVNHTESSLQFLKDQLKEYVLIAGPWISNGLEEEIVIRTSFVVNEVKKN